MKVRSRKLLNSDLTYSELEPDKEVTKRKINTIKIPQGTVFIRVRTNMKQTNVFTV